MKKRQNIQHFMDVLILCCQRNYIGIDNVLSLQFIHGICLGEIK